MMQSADNESGDSDADSTSPLYDKREISDDSSRYGSNVPPPAILEPAHVYKSRWRSIRVMYLVMFLGSVTFTITMSSLWPFLQVLNPTASASFLGWVVAAYSMGQLVASPFFGGWANLRKSSREPLAVSLVLTILSNVFYMYLESLPSDKQYYMILARGLIGFSAGNVAVVRSYVSGATTVEERTASMANLSIFQAMGFILGPVIQAALVPFSYPGPVHTVYFHFNMYTAPAFFAACVASISVLLLIFIFKEHQIVDADIQAILQSKSTDVEVQGSVINSSLTDSLMQLQYKPDYLAVCSSIFLFFIVLFMFTVFETIGTPLTMDMYAWTKDRATLYQGIILGVAGVLSIIVFLLVKILAKKYSERLLLLGGFVFCLCGYFTFIPWGNHFPPIGYATLNQTISKPGVMFSMSDYSISPGPGGTNNQIFKRDTVMTGHILDLTYNFAIPDLRDHGDTVNGGSIVTGRDSSNEAILSFKSDDNQQKKNISNLNDEIITPPSLFNANVASSSSITTTSAVSHSTTLLTTTTASTSTGSTSAPNGCPWQYDWCMHVPVIYLAQFLCGTVLISIGYPVCNMLSYALYSKMLGPKPQGLWMGWLTASGSLARTVGPIYVSQVYDSYGPQITFGSCCGIIGVTIVYYLVVYRRMVPFTLKEESLPAVAGGSGRV